MDKKTIMVGILIATAVYVAAEGVITTQEGDLKLNPARDLTATVPGGDVFINGAWVRTRNKLGYSAAGGSSFISDLLYWYHNGADGVITTSSGKIILNPAGDNVIESAVSPTFRLSDARSIGWYGGEIIGAIDFHSEDSSGPNSVAFIKAVNEETSNTVPSGALVFYTADAWGTATERFRISKLGQITMANAVIKSTTGDIEFQPAGGDVHMNANGLSMKTPNGNWACCNPDDNYNWKCTPGKCT